MFIYITLFTIFIMHPSKGVQKVFRRVRSLVVSDLRPETKGSRPGSSPGAGYVQRWAPCNNRSANA